MDEKKVREAIDDFKELSGYMRETGYCNAVKHCDLAIEALEKQLPKKVVIWGNRTEHCPVCDKDVTCTGFCVCPECYQLLDWSEAH